MAQYKVLQKSFINNDIVEEGETIEYDGKAGSNLELIPLKRAQKNSAATHGALASEEASPDQEPRLRGA